MDRNYILSEIRRTAEENGGVPLGRDRFRIETGIREFDWNKFWPRWSAVIREAGLAPNQFTTATPEEALFEKVASLIRELQHFPVTNELRIRAHSDKSFPAKDTLLKRFGGIPGLKAKLYEFSAARGYDDVVALCRPSTTVSSSSSSSSEKNKVVELGSVYILKSGRFYKIGHSNAVGRRERELAIQLPEKGRIVHTIKTDDPCGIEEYWHRRFADRRKNGEWFELTAADLSAFRKRKFM